MRWMGNFAVNKRYLVGDVAVSTSGRYTPGEKTLIVCTVEHTATSFITGNWVAMADQTALGSRVHVGTFEVLGALAQSCDRSAAISAAALVSGTARAVGLKVRAGVTYNTINWLSGSTALAGGTHQWSVLMSTAAGLLGVSADDTAAANWAANTAKAFALAAPYTPVIDSNVYAVIDVVATTPPSLMGTQPATTATGLTPISCGTISGQTGGPPSMPGSLSVPTASNVHPLCWLT